jgi:hypothetical protein
VVDYAPGALSPIGTPAVPGSLFALIASGYAGGAWNGPGLNSSTAASLPGHALGFGDAASNFSSFPAIFFGQNVDESSVLVRYTLGSDANLDGSVNLADFNRLASNFGQSSRPFALGDFNYDAQADLADFNILASNFGMGLSPTGALTMQRTNSTRRSDRIAIDVLN